MMNTESGKCQSLREWLLAKRVALGMSHRRFSAFIGMDETNWSKFRRGHVSCGPRNWLRIVEVFGRDAVPPTDAMARRSQPSICERCGAAYVLPPSAARKYCSRVCRKENYPRSPASERFWRHVDKTDGCWLWTASVRRPLPYGQFNDRATGKNWSAHRYSWVLHYGDIPNGLHVLHECDTPRCVRPEHLFLGTPLDNSNDKIAKGRAGCGAGSRGEQHPRAKLKVDDVRLIRRLRAEQGASLNALARRFGVSSGSICHIISGRNWKHVA